MWQSVCIIHPCDECGRVKLSSVPGNLATLQGNGAPSWDRAQGLYRRRIIRYRIDRRSTDTVVWEVAGRRGGDGGDPRESEGLSSAESAGHPGA